MKPPPFTYHDPATVDEAVALLGEKDNARLLAGGQSLMPMLNMRLRAARRRDRHQQDRRTVLDRGQGRRASHRRHDAPARHRVLRGRHRRLPDHARGDPPGRPPPDPQPRHARRQPRPSRSVGRAADRRDGGRRDGPCPRQGGEPRHRHGRLPGGLYDALDRARRDDHRRHVPVMARRPRLRFRRVFATPRRLRHRLGGGAAGGRRRRQGRTRLADGRRRRARRRFAAPRPRA